MNVLVINCGSSSLKYQLINSDTEEVLAKGLCERIGIDGRLVYQKAGCDKEITEASMPTHKEAIQMVLDALTNDKTGAIASLKEVNAIGHRVVHGGEKFASSVVITDEVIQAVEECNDLAPLHNPANLIGIRVCGELMPGVPQVAVFDTAFHQTMPAKAYLYGLPLEYYKNYKVRRYGFHGTSHSFVSKRAVEFLDKEIEELARRIRKMKEQGTHLCCSIGFLTEKQARMLRKAGLDRINHNLNSSRSYYHNICSTHTFEQRVQNIRMLQGIGFEICSGGIIGMGESKEDVVDMLLELREIQPEALPINFLLPIKGTPLGDADISMLTTEYCMKVLCLARLLVPKADIRCAAGREVYFKGEEKKLLSVVDSIFASGYLTEDGQGIEDTLKTITDAGFTYEIESA